MRYRLYLYLSVFFFIGKKKNLVTRPKAKIYFCVPVYKQTMILVEHRHGDLFPAHTFELDLFGKAENIKWKI